MPEERSRENQECREHGPEHLTGAVVRPDGTIFKRLIDGTVDKILPNGTRTKALLKEIPETFPYLYKKEAKYPDDPSGVHHSYLGILSVFATCMPARRKPMSFTYMRTSG